MPQRPLPNEGIAEDFVARLKDAHTSRQAAEAAAAKLEEAKSDFERKRASANADHIGVDDHFLSLYGSGNAPPAGGTVPPRGPIGGLGGNVGAPDGAALPNGNGTTWRGWIIAIAAAVVAALLLWWLYSVLSQNTATAQRRADAAHVLAQGADDKSDRNASGLKKLGERVDGIDKRLTDTTTTANAALAAASAAGSKCNACCSSCSAPAVQHKPRPQQPAPVTQAPPVTPHAPQVAAGLPGGCIATSDGSAVFKGGGAIFPNGTEVARIPNAKLVLLYPGSLGSLDAHAAACQSWRIEFARRAVQAGRANNDGHLLK